MKKFSAIKENWIILIILIQPVLDILSYFQSTYLGKSYTSIIRLFLLFVVFIIVLKNSDNKKRLIMQLSPFAIFFLIHILNLYRINLIHFGIEARYYIQIVQMPVLAILFIDYIKNNSFQVDKIKKGLFGCYLIMIFSILLAYITKTYNYTYEYGVGITGWFSSANTASMVLCALTPWALYYSLKKHNIYIYSLIAFSAFALLYTNGTRACYYTLIASFLVIIYISIVCAKSEFKNKSFKIVLNILLFLLSLFFYNKSFTSIKENISLENTQEMKEVIDNDDIIKGEIKKKAKEYYKNKNIVNDEELAEVKSKLEIMLEYSYIYGELIKIHGVDAVIEALNGKMDYDNLSNNRYRKIINAKIEYNKSDKITKWLGFGYSVISDNSLDLENDLHAIYYYYGYIGITLYILFFLIFAKYLFVSFIKDKKVLLNGEFIILAFLLLLLAFGGEYTGAFLRKANANIYLSLYLVLIYYNYYSNYKYKKDLKNKISFLLLHIGYGGIETSTINTANELSKHFDVEIISLYNLKNNQEFLINKNVNYLHLYNGEPNKEDFYNAIKAKNIIRIIKEGIKAIKILYLKKHLIKKYIKNSDSKVIISTRFEFSELLSKYKNPNSIAIAQEHHHHNNNRKYINILKRKYNNLDYLFALTKSLASDYKDFLKNNKKTKIFVMPNMIDIPKKYTKKRTNNIISVGRLHPGKKVDELIDIFSETKNAKDFFVIGDGEEYNNISSKINAMKLKKKIKMLGYLKKNEIEKYYLKSDIFVMASISEGLPMVLLEAMSYGIPCIAYETESGIKDVIDDNKNGYIIKNRNSKDFTKKIDELLNNKELYNQLSKNAYIKSQEYSKENIAKKWNDILKSII